MSGPLMLLAFGLLASGCVAVQEAGAFKQCGGVANCKGHDACVDGAWPDVECIRGYVCGRQNEFYWQCTNEPSAIAEARQAGIVVLDPEPPPYFNPAAPPPEPLGSKHGARPRGRGANTTATRPVYMESGPAGTASKYPGLRASGHRDDEAADTLTCACVDVGINSPACFKGVTEYCEAGEDYSNTTVCEAMSAFFNMQDLKAAAVAAAFFIDACAVTVPPNPSPCACLEGANTGGCKAAALKACLSGDAICAALAFGTEANPAAQDSYAAYMDVKCNGHTASNEVAMNFTGITSSEFALKYAKGALAALTAVTGLREGAITAAAPVEINLAAGQRTRGRRRLVAEAVAPAPAAAPTAAPAPVPKSPTKVLMSYTIRSSPEYAPVVVERLQAAIDDGAARLYAALAANGVPLQPTVSVNRGPVVGDSKPEERAALKAAAPHVFAFDSGVLAGVIVGGIALLSFVSAVIAILVMRRRQATRDSGAEALPTTATVVTATATAPKLTVGPLDA